MALGDSQHDFDKGLGFELNTRGGLEWDKGERG
jgi:hypothetical protein